MAINAQAPRVLAEEAARLGALLVHYATDYAVDGEKQGPWTEEDRPDPLNVYGRSKLAGERAMEEVGGRYLIFRTSWVYGAHGANFLLTMLRLAQTRERIAVVDDQHGSPTTAIELANATCAIVKGAMEGKFGAEENWAGLYQMTCSGETTWCGFARAIFERAGMLLGGKAPIVIPSASAEYSTPARRPRNSVLSNAKLNKVFGVQLAPWEAALDAVVRELEAQSALD